MDDLLIDALHYVTYAHNHEATCTCPRCKLRARIQQRLDTGGWIAGNIIDAGQPFRSVEPSFVGKPIWTWRESDGQWFRHDPLPALPKEK